MKERKYLDLNLLVHDQLHIAKHEDCFARARLPVLRNGELKNFPRVWKVEEPQLNKRTILSFMRRAYTKRVIAGD